jgi:predicted RNase H-like nuclease (RuvC/YqgF family)
MELSEELEQLLTDKIAEALGAARQEILADVHKANQGLATSLSKEIKKLQPEVAPAEADGDDKSEGKLSLKALNQQIADLNQKLAEKDRKAFEAERDRALSTAISTLKTNNPTGLYKILATDYGSKMKLEKDTWYVEDGETVTPLDQALAGYLKTEEGRWFVPSSGVNGAGAIETKSTVTTAQGPVSSTEAINSAFANI